MCPQKEDALVRRAPRLRRRGGRSRTQRAGRPGARRKARPCTCPCRAKLNTEEQQSLEAAALKSRSKLIALEGLPAPTAWLLRATMNWYVPASARQRRRPAPAAAPPSPGRMPAARHMRVHGAAVVLEVEGKLNPERLRFDRPSFSQLSQEEFGYCCKACVRRVGLS